MDLGAYIQIESLERIAEANGIEVERVRGYRLMGESEAYSDEEIAKSIKNMEGSYWWINSNTNEDWFDHPEEEYQDGYRPARWNKMTIGIFKELSMLRARHKRQRTLWNRYVGKDDVLYIHSRCGEGWRKYKDKEWFIDGCLDAFDPTYCDIYARIEVKE